eukprot:905741-Prorocentrum_lima.AAC.1
MTSSLVGSEMCIRDSCITEHRTQAPKRDIWSHLVYVPHALYFGSSHTDAVSYTHLTLPTICSV